MNRILNNCYDRSGNLDPELTYVEFYKSLPNTYRYKFPSKLDREKMNFELIKDLFYEISCVVDRQAVYPENDDDEESDLAMLVDFGQVSYGNNSIMIVADRMVVHITCEYIIIFYNDYPIEKIKLLIESIYNKIPKEASEEKPGIVNIIQYGNGSYYLSEQEINKQTIDISENYNDDFLPIYEDTVAFLKNRSSGLILYHGKVGAGKTNLIRHLITTIPKEYVIVPTSIALKLGDPDLAGFILEHQNAVFILEDCEQLLEDRSQNVFNGSINTILNMSDGLLGDIYNIKFICTFNADISSIDPALLRKGRCAAKYEFKELCKEKVAALNDKYHLGHTEIKPMTLAEVYNAETKDYTKIAKQKKIGF